MPNHVTTRCMVTGPTPDIAAFRKQMIIWDERSELHLQLGFDRLPAELIAGIEESIVSIAANYKNGHTRFDFEKIIPAPAILNQVVESTSSELGTWLMILRGERAPFMPISIDDASIRWVRADVGMLDAPMHEVAAAFLQKHPDYEAAGRLRLQALVATGSPGWHSWNIANWGTNGNAYSFRLVSDDPLEFAFNTAWDFPWPVFEALARKFSNLQFKCLTFDESGSFGGEGCFNPINGEQPYQLCEATDELFGRVYSTAAGASAARG
jgi:hypothetical protein